MKKLKNKIKNWCRYWHFNITGVLSDNEGHQNYLNVVSTLEDYHNTECFIENDYNLEKSWKKVLNCINKCDNNQLLTLERLCSSKKY